MPGEERKFKRRRMMALIPACNRECEEAASHAVAAGVPEIGVEVEEGRGVAVGAATSVTVWDARGV